MMNKQLIFSLFLVLLVNSTNLQAAAPSDPRNLIPAILAGATVCTAGHFSVESIKGMIEDIRNNKTKHTDLQEDTLNIVKTTALVAGLAYLGANYIRDENAKKYIAQSIGTGAILGSAFLGLKHGCGNQSLRLREVVAGVTLASGACYLLSKAGCAFRFGS